MATPSWSEVTYSFGLDWHINDDILAYVKNSKGFKSGGFNRGSVDPLNPSGAPNVANLIVYNPEQVLATEAGIKTTFMDGRARANFSVFWYDYSDKEEAVVRVHRRDPHQYGNQCGTGDHLRGGAGNLIAVR